MDVVRNAAVLITFFLCAAGSTNALAEEFVAVKARLTGANPDFPYTIASNESYSDFRVPSATFEIISPNSLSGRIIRIVFFGGDLTDLLDESGSSYSEYFHLELPKAQFDLDDDSAFSDYRVNRIQATSDEEDQSGID